MGPGHGRLKGEIVYPRSTIMSEHTLVEIERNIDPGERELIACFRSISVE